MKLNVKIFLALASCVYLSSCTPSPPYEIKSPCVSIEAFDQNTGITPCVRRPVNSNYAIT